MNNSKNSDKALSDKEHEPSVVIYESPSLVYDRPTLVRNSLTVVALDNAYTQTVTRLPGGG